MLRLASLIALTLFVSQPAIGGQAPPKPIPGQSKEAARTPERQRLENLIRVRGFADHIQEFKNLTSRVRGLIALADVLWKEDEPYARKLFATAYEAAGSNAESESSDSGSDSKTPDYGWLRREVAAAISRHDPAWARILTAKEAETSKSSEAYLQMAGALLRDDPKQAVQYIETGLNAGSETDLYSLLYVLRQKDPAAADAIFLRSLERLAARPQVPAFQLLWFGNYVLTIDFGQPVSLARHEILNVAGTNPSASLASITAYLNAAVDILSRPVLSSSDTIFSKEANYIAACVLLPSVRQLTPERAPQLEASMRDLAPDISTDLTEDAVRAKINEARSPSVNTLEEARKDVDAIRDDTRHDLRCIDLSHAFFLKDDFQAAKAIGGEVKDLQIRDKLLLLLAFEEGAKLVDRGKPNDATSIATKLSSGIERAILWLAIAQKQIDRGDTKLARTTMSWALAEASRLQDPRRAVLILRAAADLAAFDPVLASQTLTEAIRTFNSVSPYSPLKMGWEEPIGPRPTMPSFPLKVAGLDFQLARMLSPLAKIDMEGTIYDVMSLDDEEARGQGLAILASLILEGKATKNRSKNQLHPNLL
jgi:hypothetical protein